MIYTDTMKESAWQDEKGLSAYRKDVSRFPRLSTEESWRLAQKARKGDVESLHCLVCSNLRLVLYIAKSYRGRSLDYLDLVSEGNLGLIRAVKTWDIEKGAFSTYASFWIRQTIQRAITNKDGFVRFPNNKALLARRVKRYRGIHQERYGEEASYEEIADALSAKAKDVKDVLSVDVSSLPMDLAVNWIDDFFTTDAENEWINNDFMSTLLAGLNTREREIIKLNFGIGGEAPMSYEKIGRIIGLSRERVRQLKERALGQLRVRARKI